MKPIENIDEVREAYENTLKHAAEDGKDEFYCGLLHCSKCPFKMYSGSCNDPNVKGGAGEWRTVQAWQQWWYELTGETDTRTVEQILAGTQTVESAEETVESTEDTSQPVEPTVSTREPTISIVWNTAAGKIENHTGTMSLLCSEIDRFRKELSVWLECMNRPVNETPNSLVDYISFIATAQDGAIICQCQLFADQFGKRKVWESTER